MKIHAERVGKTLSLEADIQPELEVRADPSILNRVLENLLWNAIKYSPPSDQIRLTASVIGDQISVKVKNDCEIIPHEELARLFNTFVVGPNDGQDHILRSTGLGLAFCKLAIEEHGQQILAESPAPDKESGIELSFTLAIKPGLDVK